LAAGSARTRWGSLNVRSDPLAAIQEPTFKVWERGGESERGRSDGGEKEGRGVKGEIKWEGKGRGGGKRRGKGRGM